MGCTNTGDTFKFLTLFTQKKPTPKGELGMFVDHLGNNKPLVNRLWNWKSVD